MLFCAFCWILQKHQVETSLVENWWVEFWGLILVCAHTFWGFLSLSIFSPVWFFGCFSSSCAISLLFFLGCSSCLRQCLTCCSHFHSILRPPPRVRPKVLHLPGRSASSFSTLWIPEKTPGFCNPFVFGSLWILYGKWKEQALVKIEDFWGSCFF